MTDWYWGIPREKNEFKSTSISEDEIYRFQNEVWFSGPVHNKSINKLIKLIKSIKHVLALGLNRFGLLTNHFSEGVSEILKKV